MRLSMSYESFFPSSYVSPADGSSYQALFGNNYGTIFGGSLGVQYNTRIGAFYVEGLYGAGSVIGMSPTTNLSIIKYGATLGYLMDTLVESPWVSPFVAAQVFRFGYNESDTGISQGGTTALTVGTMAGISIHLDKIDADAARIGYEDDGLRNAFLDIYGIQYNTSNSASDPDFQTTWNIGAGFHFEF